MCCPISPISNHNNRSPRFNINSGQTHHSEIYQNETNRFGKHNELNNKSHIHAMIRACYCCLDCFACFSSSVPRVERRYRRPPADASAVQAEGSSSIPSVPLSTAPPAPPGQLLYLRAFEAAFPPHIVKLWCSSSMSPTQYDTQSHNPGLK